MGYTFTTEYTVESMTVMAKGRRKTLRSKRHRRSEILSIVVIGIALLALKPDPGEKFVFTAGNIITILAVLFLVATLRFEDKLNAWVGYKRMVKGMSPATCTFEEENFTSVTGVGTTTFNYPTISAIAESKDYFVFMIDNNHAQLYDKSTITGGTAEDFARFITAKTGLEIKKI